MASDHFSAWMALGGAGIALVATLAGAVVTSVLENRRDALRRAHSDQVEEVKRQHERAVRFHDERLSAYIEYMGAVSSLFAIATVWIDNGAIGSFDGYANQHGNLTPYTKAMTRVSMLAKPEVNAKADEVHSFVRLLLSSNAPDVVRRAIDGSIPARGEFETAAKKELGII